MKISEKNKARKLREQEGLSYRTIAERLGVTKGSVSKWCKDIELTDEQLKISSNNCRIKNILGGKRNKERWDKIKNDFLADYFPPFDNPRFMLGLGLYWGEGSKYSESTTEFSNCDHRVIKKFLEWLSEFFQECKYVCATIHHYCPEKDNEVKKYWSNNLDLPLSCFRKSVFALSKSSAKKKGNILPNGTAHITCQGKDIWKVQQKIRKALAVV